MSDELPHLTGADVRDIVAKATGTDPDLTQKLYDLIGTSFEKIAFDARRATEGLTHDGRPLTDAERIIGTYGYVTGYVVGAAKASAALIDPDGENRDES